MSSCDLLPLVVFMCNRNYQWKTNASLLGLRLVALRFLDFSYDPYISILHPMLFGQHRVKFCTFEVSLPFDRCRPDNLVAQAQFWKFCPWIIFSFSGMPSVFGAFPKFLGKSDGRVIFKTGFQGYLFEIIRKYYRILPFQLPNVHSIVKNSYIFWSFLTGTLKIAFQNFLKKISSRSNFFGGCPWPRGLLGQPCDLLNKSEWCLEHVIDK